MHACELATALGIPRVIVPVLPGALSAYGILVSDVVKDYSRSVLWRVTAGLPRERLRSEFARLQRTAESDLRREHWLGVPRLQRSVDVRYRGQGYELNVPFNQRLVEAFHQQHRQRYGYSQPGRELEIVTLRLRASLPALARPRGIALARRKAAEMVRMPVIFDGRARETAIYDRAGLRAGKLHAGPAVVTEYSATTVVPPGMRFRVDRAGNLVIETR